MDTYNVEFMKIQDNVDESINRFFANNEKNKDKGGDVKSVNQLYANLWNRVELPAGFEQNYSNWLDTEIWGIFD